MTDQITTRTCPDCRTIFRHRGQDRCPNCGHRFDAVRSEPGTETRDVPPLPPVERPAPTPPSTPPPPPAPAPAATEPVYEPTGSSASELDSLLLPYASNTVRRTEPPEARIETTIPPIELPPPPPPPPPVVYEETPPPVPIPEPTAHTRSMDPVDEALAGEHLVPADARLKKRQSRMPWYLRRETLIGLALVAVVLIAVIVQLSS